MNPGETAWLAQTRDTFNPTQNLPHAISVKLEHTQVYFVVYTHTVLFHIGHMILKAPSSLEDFKVDTLSVHFLVLG